MAPGRKRLSTYIIALLNDGYRRTQIETNLVEHGHNTQFVKEMVSETIRMRRSRLLLKFMVLLLAGTIICLLCALCMNIPGLAQNNLP